jgi:oligoribonuclease NrnB/cAMP/cGMP phosphodiesterase (DHH superfamily)
MAPPDSRSYRSARSAAAWATLAAVRKNLIYHAGCPDGFGAAWAAWRRWGNDARYIPRGHDDRFDPKRFRGDLIVFADISLSNAAMLALAEVADQIVVLDHHITARDQFEADPAVENVMRELGHAVHFDLDHSGAILAWNHFHPDETAPDLLLYVEDQDLWNWKLPRSEEVNAAIGSYNRDFDVWNRLAERPSDDLAREGDPIVRFNQIEVQRALQHTHAVRIGNERIEAVNALNQRAALGHELAKREQYGKRWGLVYRVSGERVDCSIYSTGDLDISAVATRFGGGGHRNASGFSVTLADWLENFA